LEKRDLADLADTSEDEELLLSSTITLLVGEPGTGTLVTEIVAGIEIIAEVETVAAVATALVEDIFIQKGYWFGVWQKTKRKRASVNSLKSSAAVPNIVMSFARSSTAWIKHALFHLYNASKRYRSVLGLLQVSQRHKKYSRLILTLASKT
jgi:hypothetical protein